MKILLTGDDGYDAIGIRLLIHFLKKEHKLKIAGTKTKQSGIGGKINFNKKVAWGETSVSGVPAIWVAGTPVDAIGFAWNHFKEKFDLVIAGINWGANMTMGIFSSGTLAAALRAISLRLAPRGMVASYNCSPEDWWTEDKSMRAINRCLEYPGKEFFKIFNLALKNDLWGARLLNINFPYKPTRKIRFTKFCPYVTDFYNCKIKINRKAKNYILPPGIMRNKLEPSFDAGAMQRGEISISPFRSTFTDEKIYRKLKGLKIRI